MEFLSKFFKSDSPIKKVLYLVFLEISKKTSFFLIKNCMALLGNDSFSTHVASGFNKSIVSLFSNTFKECCGPYWGDSEKQVLIQADTRGKKPSFAAREKDKAVNNICCGEIARSLLGLLHIDHEPVNKFRTLHNGVLYGQKAQCTERPQK